MKSFEQFKKEQFRKKLGLKKPYDNLGPQYELAAKVIDARLKKGLNQAQLAKRMETTQSAIARLESGDYNASVAFLQKVANAIGRDLKVTLE